MQIDCGLSLNIHIDEICKKAKQTLNILLKTAPYMNLSKQRMLVNALFST